MNQTALDTLRSHDAVVFMTDLSQQGSIPKAKFRPDMDPLHPDDRRLLTLLPPGTPTLLVLNKVDLLRDKQRMLPLITAFNEAYAFAATVPTSMLTGDGAERVLEELIKLLPEGESRYPSDEFTDRPATFFVREFIREQIMLTTQREVPHAVAVTVERYDEAKVDRIQATIHVEKAGQRVILVGKGGEGVKAIGIAARARLEELLGKQIHLELFIRVTERWKDVPRQLSELGYANGAGGRSLSNLLPAEERAKTRPKRKKATVKDKTTARANSPGARRKKFGPNKGRALGAKASNPKPGASRAEARPGKAQPRKARPGKVRSGKARPGKAQRP
jgi:GTP-binding protein Era